MIPTQTNEGQTRKEENKQGIKLFQQSKGQKLAVLMVGEWEEVEESFCSFYNWAGSLDTELRQTGKENSLWFWTTRKRLLNYYQNIIEHKFYLRYGYEPGERGQAFIREAAQKKLESIPYLNFLPRSNGRFYL